MARLLGHAENTGFSRDPKPRIPGSGHFFISLLNKQLGEMTALEDKHVNSTKSAHEHTKIWSTNLSELNSIFRELLRTEDPVLQANEKYRLILERIATASGPGYNATLLEKMALEQRDSAILKVLTTDQEKIDQVITKHVPMMSADVLAIQRAATAQNLLTAAQRAALPLGIQLDNVIARELQRSREIVAELVLRQIPARRQIELGIQRQIDAADREIIALRQQYEQHKITRAVMEADEQAYSDLMISLAEQRKRALEQETMAQITSITMQGAALLQTLGFRKAAAIVETVWETAESIKAFANLDFYSGTMHALAAAQYAIIAGQSSKSSSMYGAVSAASPGGALSASTSAAGSPTGSGTTPPALAPGAASGAQRGAAPPEAPIVINVTIGGSVYGGQRGLDELAQHISLAVQQRDINLVARRVLMPPYATR